MDQYDDRPDRPSPDDEKKVQEAAERFELLEHVSHLLDPIMTVLGLAFLALLLADFAGGSFTIAGSNRLDDALTAIWVAFVVDFVLRLVIAPDTWGYLRRNWLTVLSLALPFLRPLRALRAARALRSMSLVRLLGGINRGMRLLQRVTRGRQFAYVGALTLLVTLVGAVGVRFFDRNVEGAPIQTFGDALWWSTAMVTTINNELYAVSLEARVIAILQRVYAVSVFGYITASIASYLIGSAKQSPESGDYGAEISQGAGNGLEDMHVVVRDLRFEVAALRRTLERLEETGPWQSR